MFLLRVVGLCLLVAGCSGAQLLNRVSGDAGVVTSREAYGAGARRGADVYAPAGSRDAPVVVFFYGGSWQNGAKEDYAFVGRALARRGFVVVIPDYRVYPEVKFAGFMEDGAAAVAWARRNARRIGGDPDRLALMGHSAGAQIALLLTLDRHWLKRDGVDPGRDLAGVVGLAGPYDFLPLQDPVLQTIFGPPARLADTQPINFVDGRNPPLFLATDADDRTVLPKNTYNLSAAVRRAGGPVTEKTYPGLSHALLIGVVSEPLSGLAPVLDDVTGFLRALPSTKNRTASR